MGQNDSKQIQSTVSHLQSQKHISHSQAQKFLHDYHTNDQSVKDVTEFDNNRLKLFLKYFINHKYRATQTLLTKRTKTNQSANNENNYDQLMGTLCFETQKIQEKMVRCHQDINSFILYETLEMFEQMIKSTLAQIGINELIMRIKSNDKSIKITFKKSQNLLIIEQDNGQSLSKLLSHKYRFRKVQKQNLIKEKFLSSAEQYIAEHIFVEEIITREKYVLLMTSFVELNSLTEENSQIFSKVSKLSSAIGDFLDQMIKFIQFYTQSEQESRIKKQNNNHVAEICWNVLKIYKSYFDFQHYYFVNKLISEYKNLLHLTSNQSTFKHIKSKVQQLFSKKQKSQETGIQVLKSFQQYEKKYLIIKNNLSDYLQRYFRAISEDVLQFEFDLNTELKVLVSSGQSKESQFLFDQVRQIVEKQAMPTLLDVFKDLDSFKQFYKDSYHQALKNTKSQSQYERDGISLQFSFRDQVLQSIRIAVSQGALSKQMNSQNNLMINHNNASDQKKKLHNFLSIELQNEKQNISQLSSTINIKINSKPSSPKNISILDLTMNDETCDQHFDIFDCQLNLLTIPKQVHLSLAIKIMENVSFYKSNLSKSQFKFMNFLSALRIGYLQHNNPFHNFTHGVNVMHTTFLLISMKQVKQKLSQFSQFALVFSALCHDVGHTGFNNAFQIATQSTLAETFNDVSPLQNYHIHRTFKTLKQSSCNFLDSLDNSQKTQLRKFIISNILNTDVKQHFNVLKRFEEKKNQFKKGDFQDQKIISGMLIHSSDFAGSVKEFPICYQWSQMVNEEFKNQSIQQSKLNLPLSPFMMNLENPLVLAKNEMGFLKFMVQPLYKSIAGAFLNENAKKMYERVNNNIIEWQKIIKSLGG